jgi:hypothetical protein
MRSVNGQYNVAAPRSFADRVATRARRQMFDRFLRFAQPSASDLVLDVGATSDRDYQSSNYFEAWYPHRDRVVAVGLEQESLIDQDFPGVRYVCADGLALPFRDRSFDIVHASAVIEHVGSRERQRRFVRELCRVARRCVFVTTPNRFYPLEFHTLLPLVHWLPRPMFDRALRVTGRAAFADEGVLNLLDRSGLAQLADVRGWANRIESIRLLGLPSNLLLMMRRLTESITDDVVDEASGQRADAASRRVKSGEQSPLPVPTMHSERRLPCRFPSPRSCCFSLYHRPHLPTSMPAPEACWHRV